MSQFSAQLEEGGKKGQKLLCLERLRQLNISNTLSEEKGKRQGSLGYVKPLSILHYENVKLIPTKKRKKKEKRNSNYFRLLGLLFKTLVSFQPTSNQFQAPMRYMCKTLTESFQYLQLLKRPSALKHLNTKMTNSRAIVGFSMIRKNINGKFLKRQMTQSKKKPDNSYLCGKRLIELKVFILICSK